MVAGGVGGGHRGGHRCPGVLPRGESLDEAGRQIRRRLTRRRTDRWRAALWKRKRTLVAFSLFLLGFAFTVFIGLAGFIFILLGGWLMLRAWRINKYGTTNSKVIASEAATRPRGRQRKETARSTSKAASTPGARKPPTASKRYTPKAPTRKKIPKETD